MFIIALMMSFSEKILLWYATHKRDLPWRKTTDPYKIWLSEIMLQQTRVAQGMPYYFSFVKHFPKVENLAAASEEQVLKLWQGLGYYSRARNLHATAKIVTEQYNGQFPSTYKELIKLKGVGDYTASAIASFCFNQPEPVVDGNVYRVLSRYFGVDIPINTPKGISYFKELAQQIKSTDNIRDYNQGIMEFGAIQCTPKNPNCISCPLQDSCVALKDNIVDTLPVKIKKTKIKNRFFNYVVCVDEDEKVQLQKREGKGIWQNMFEFPLIESEKEISAAEFQKKLPEVMDHLVGEEVILYNKEPIVHKLSHQHLHTKFWIVHSNHLHNNGIAWSKIEEYPVPVLLADFIKAFKI